MSLLIVISHNSLLSVAEIKDILEPNEGVMPLNEWTFLVRVSMTPKMAQEKLKKHNRDFLFTIFSPPTTAWITSLDQNELKEWIRDGINGEATVLEA